APLRFDGLPPPPHLSERLQISALWNGRVRLPQPAMQPELLGPHDVAQRAVNPAVAALQVAKVLLAGKLGDRIKDRAVRPFVVIEQLEELVQLWQQVDAQQASVGEAAVNCDCVSPTFTTNTSHR